MSLIKSKSHSPLFSNLWDEVLSRDLFELPVARNLFKVPAVNIKETDTAYSIEVAAPGLDKKDLKVDVDNGLLTVSSEKESKKEEKDDNFTRKEFSYHSFSRSFTLPDHVSTEKISAKYENGILHIGIPKKEETKTKAKKDIAIS